jgi:hypothetical protein
MKRAAFEKQRKRAQKDNRAVAEWMKKLYEHPIPDIQVELSAMYHKQSGDTNIKKIKCNEDDCDIILETEDEKTVLVWRSPVTRAIRYGPQAKPWPVADKSLWPLSGKRTYQPPHIAKDIWEYICRFSDPSTLLALSLVSKRVRAVVCNPRASWWETRRAALKRDYPGLVLPDKLWELYGRWGALAYDDLTPMYDDYSNFCVLTLPPGTVGFTKEGGDIREPSLTYYSLRVKNRAGGGRTFKRLMGHVRIGGTSEFICILQTVAPCRFIICWGSSWCKSPWTQIEWRHYTRALLHDKPIESYLKRWDNYENLKSKII